MTLQRDPQFAFHNRSARDSLRSQVRLFRIDFESLFQGRAIKVNNAENRRSQRSLFSRSLLRSLVLCVI
jgi:hypothetical protein